MHTAEYDIELTIKGLYMSFFTKCSVFTPATMVEIPQFFFLPQTTTFMQECFSNIKSQKTTITVKEGLNSG